MDTRRRVVLLSARMINPRAGFDADVALDVATGNESPGHAAVAQGCQAEVRLEEDGTRRTYREREQDSDNGQPLAGSVLHASPAMTTRRHLSIERLARSSRAGAFGRDIPFRPIRKFEFSLFLTGNYPPRASPVCASRHLTRTVVPADSFEVPSIVKASQQTRSPHWFLRHWPLRYGGHTVASNVSSSVRMRGFRVSRIIRNVHLAVLS